MIFHFVQRSLIKLYPKFVKPVQSSESTIADMSTLVPAYSLENKQNANPQDLNQHKPTNSNEPNKKPFTQVEKTSFFMAGGRAIESSKPPKTRLYNDPYAQYFSGKQGHKMLKSMSYRLHRTYRPTILRIS